VTRDVLAWIVPVLTVWLAIGVLTARLFGALVTDEDDQEVTEGSRALIEPGGLSVGSLISDRPVEVGSRGAQPLATHGPGRCRASTLSRAMPCIAGSVPHIAPD
jgi:hypothetical protein